VNVTVNGREADVPDGATVQSVLALLELAPDSRGVAVAVDAEVLPRGEWTSARLTPGARVEVLRAVQGG